MMDEEEDDPAGQWRWLEGVLEKSLRNRETVYLVGHVPPGVDERRPNSMAYGAFKERFNRRYLRLVRKYSQVIVGQFFGHHHSDSFRVIYSERGQPISWMFLAPSVTPWRTPSGANNPGLRLYKFDTDTGQVLDYVQYFLNLSSANHRDHAEWQLEYNLTSLYGLPNVSAASLHELAETFRSGPTVDNSASFYGIGGYGGYAGNGGGWGSSAVPLPVVSPMLGVDLFERYYRANSVGYHHGSGWGTCSAHCRRGHYCSITRVDYAAFRECMEADLGDGTAGCARPQSLLLWSLCGILLILLRR
ncbi:acid sphingomyelinase-like phosphodiesterase 3b [Hetaerina americana]|uniref:acid sphingomyelinase-like phosphodiesterase 3b n=1 Tax=Hetaerina americana TaxID=62018 RepID=UPI003A7F28D3